MIDLRVLGTLAIHRPGEPTPVALTRPKHLALLLHLALAEPAGLKSRDSLVALLWPEADAESARHALRNALHGLREMLGDTAIVSRGNGYVGLDLAVVHCDALELRRLLAEQHWEEAVAAWHGDLAPGFNVSGAPEFERWLDDQRTGLRRAVTEAAWRRVGELEQSGDTGVVAAARRAWALEPEDEAGARRLMEFLHTAAGRSAALRAYDELADYLRREYDTEPSAQTRALAAELKARIEPQLALAPPALPAPPEPAAPQTAAVAAAGFPVDRRRRSVAVAGIAGALLMAGVVSVVALRPARWPSRLAGEDSIQAERDSAFRLPAKYRQDTAAYASYLRGLALRFSAPPSVSRDTFAALVERKPLYAPGLSGLAHAYALTTVFGRMPPAEGWPKVEAAARKAIALDSASASAYMALGLMEMFWHWNIARGGQLIDKGLALEPADPEAHALRGVWFRWRGETDSNVAEARKSYALDPLNPYWGVRLARQLRLDRKYAESEAMYRRMLRDYPRDGELYNELSDVYKAMGRMRDALEIFRTAAEASGDSLGAAQVPVTTSDAEAARVFADWNHSELRDLERRKQAGEVIAADAWADVHAKLQDKDETLRWFDSMLVARDPGLLAAVMDPVYDYLRDDPRYRAWKAKLPWLEPKVTNPIAAHR
jgi:DNA-binding SARP family transcriptional activator